MKTNYIELKPDRLNFPLATLNVGKLSSAVLTVGGDIPDDTAALVVKVEYATGSPPSYYLAGGTKQPDGTWRFYLAPGYFPATATAFKYHVYITDSYDNPRWMGCGVLRVLDNPSDGSSPAPEVLPKNLYAYNPVNHLYYKITAEADAEGNITIALDQEGVSL